MHSDSPGLPRLTAPIVLGIILAAAGSVSAAPAVPMFRSKAAEEEPPPKDQPPIPKLSVGDCLRIALEKQPKLAGLRASVASASAGLAGQEHAPFAIRLTGDHKYRVMQASNGVLAAQAELDQAIHDVTQAVVWTYYSVVYARAQVNVAKEAVEFVDFYRARVAEIVNSKEGSKDINQITLNRLVARLAEGKRLYVRAQMGLEQAKAALREAMGVEPSYVFNPAETVLPDFAKIEIKKEDVIEQARARRGEVIMSNIFLEISRLEVSAQGAIHVRFRAETAASGGDIHSRPIPPGSKDGDYRPDALAPDMPVQLTGNRSTRTQRACAIAERSEAVCQKTRNLVTLEAEKAWDDYYYSGLSMTAAKEQAEAGNKNLVLLKPVVGDKVSSAATLQQLLEAEEEAAKGTAAYNEAVYQRIAALANIERITAGGFKINYPGR
jgi:outer membrane protein TolC